jgi:asparagine synthase (glutamine-hydrolysing)
MCAIAVIVALDRAPVSGLARRLAVMNDLQRHRGPDGAGIWTHPARHVGLANRRLAVVGLDGGRQPMRGEAGRRLVYNGEIYNDADLRARLGGSFRTTGDTEVVLRAFAAWGPAAAARLRGMFAFAVWDEPRQTLFCARDRYGIKPLYYAVADGVFYAASEIKALLPFLPSIETDADGFQDYLTFHCCLGDRTMFRGVRTLPPGHALCVQDGIVSVTRYVGPDGHALCRAG